MKLRKILHFYLALFLAIGYAIVPIAAEACQAKLDYKWESMKGHSSENIGRIDVNPGESLTHTFRLKNSSSCNANNYRLKIFSITNNLSGYKGKFASNTFSVNSLSTVEVGATYQAPNVKGIYRVEFDIVDGNGSTLPALSLGRLYSDINVVSSSTPKPEPEKLADLAVTNLSISKATVSPNEQVTIKTKLFNFGDASARDIKVNYMLSTNDKIMTLDAIEATESLSFLRNGANGDLSASVSAPSQSGTYYLGVCVSINAQETNTSNNCSTTGKKIEVVKASTPERPTPTPKNPDLSIEHIESAATRVKFNQSFKISAVVKNIGNAEANGTQLIYYRSSDSTINQNDTQLDSDRVSFLDPSETDNESTWVLLEQFGTFYVGVCVNSVEDEKNLRNNCSQGIKVEVVEDVKISLNSDSIDFTGLNGNIRNFEIRNLSEHTTVHLERLPAIQGFTLIPSPVCNAIPPKDRCFITVTFSPDGSKLNYREVLSVRTNAENTPSITFIGTVPTTPEISISKTQIPFGQVEIGAAPKTESLSITNTGNANLNVNSLSVSSNVFQASHNCHSVTPKNQCTVTITFDPVSEQNYSANLSINSNATTAPRGISLTGEGFKEKAAKIAYPKELDFGTVWLDESKTETLMLQNTGDATLTVSRMASSLDGFEVVQGNCSSVAPNQSCELQVTFKPTSIKEYNAPLSFSSNAETASGQHSITLKGNGDDAGWVIVPGDPPGPGNSASAKIKVTPTELAFGQVQVGDNKKLTIEVSNEGRAPLTLDAITPPSGFSLANGCGQSLETGQSCQIGVTFVPTQPELYNASLSIPSNAENGEVSVAIIAEGKAVPMANVTVIRSNVEAGTIVSEPVGMGCVEESRDGCQGSFEVGSDVTVKAVANEGFAFVGWSGACSGELPSFAFSALDADKQCHAEFVALSTELTLTPTEPQDFGTVEVGKASEPKEFVVSNTGNVDATLTESGISGVLSEQFEIQDVNNCLSKPIIQDGGQCVFDVIFKPSMSRDAINYLTLKAQQGNLPLVELKGIGEIIETFYRLVATTLPPEGVQPGSTFDITFRFVPDTEIVADGVFIGLNYDPEKLEAISITGSGVFEFEMMSEIDHESGQIGFAALNLEGDIPDEVFDLFTVTFQADENVQPQDTTMITFHDENTFSSGAEFISMSSEDIEVQFAGNAEIEINPSEINFTMELGEAEKTEKFIISNIGSSSLDIEQVTVSLPDAFSLNHQCEVIEPNNSCEVNVSFTPEQAQEFNAQVNVISNAINGVNKVILNGKATEPEPIQVQVLWDRHVDNPSNEWEIPLYYYVYEMDNVGGEPSDFTGFTETMVKHDGLFELPASNADGKDRCLVVKGKNTITSTQLFNLSTTTEFKEIHVEGELVVGDIPEEVIFNKVYKHDLDTLLDIASRELFGEDASIENSTGIELVDDKYKHFDINADGFITISAARPIGNFSNIADNIWISDVLTSSCNGNFICKLRIAEQGIRGETACSRSNNRIQNTARSLRHGKVAGAALYTSPIKELPAGQSQVIDVKLKLENLSNILATEISLEFDPKLLNVVKLERNPHFDSSFLSDFDNNVGLIADYSYSLGLQRKAKLKEITLFSVEIKTLAKNGEQTLKFSEEFQQTVSLESFTDKLPIRDAKVVFNNAGSIGTPNEVPQCPIYAIQDNGRNNTQFFTVDPLTREATPLGKQHLGADIEGLAIHPQTGALFGSSGDQTDRKGYLYSIDKQTGAITAIGATGFNEVDSIAFAPDGSLWGAAVGDGIISIDPATGAATLVVPFADAIEDMTFSLDGKTLYAAQGSLLWRYDGETIMLACDNLPGEVEALSMLPGEALMYSYHLDERAFIHVLDLPTCSTILEQGMPTDYDDIEGISWWHGCLTETAQP